MEAMSWQDTLASPKFRRMLFVVSAAGAGVSLLTQIGAIAFPGYIPSVFYRTLAWAGTVTIVTGFLINKRRIDRRK